MYRKQALRWKTLCTKTLVGRKALLLSIVVFIILCIFMQKNGNISIGNTNLFGCWKLAINSLTNDFEDSFLSPTDVVSDIPNEGHLQDMTLNDLSLLYRRYITTLGYFCSQPVRFGNTGFGGFRICAERKLSQMTGCTVQSFNYELNDLFKDQIKRRFNCTGLEHGGLDSVEESLKLDQNGEQQSIFIFKIYPPDFPKVSLIHKILDKFVVGQIIMEIHHHPQHDTKEGYVQLLSAFRRFKASKCQIYWYDRNLECIEYDKKTKLRRAKCYTINLFCDTRASFSEASALLYGKAVPALQFLSDAENLPTELKEIRFMSYISKHQILCSQVRRMGNIVDGGWDICNDVPFRPKSPCLVYSFGISFDFSFDEAMEKVYGCEVYSFDPSMGTGNCEYSKRIHFYEVGLEDKEGYITGKEKGKTWEVKRLKTIMKEFGHENRRIDVLKIDIEGHEKGSFVDILLSGALKNVAQLCVEFHSFYDLNVARKLYEIGFRIFWTHQNQAAPLYLDNETFTHGFEVSFVNVNLP